MISGSTRLVALLGQPVAGSLSPRMQNAAFAARAFEWAYVACEVAPEHLDAAVGGQDREDEGTVERTEEQAARDAGDEDLEDGDFDDTDEERFVEALVCSACGNVRLLVDLDTDVQE